MPARMAGSRPTSAGALTRSGPRRWRRPLPRPDGTDAFDVLLARRSRRPAAWRRIRSPLRARRREIRRDHRAGGHCCHALHVPGAFLTDVPSLYQPWDLQHVHLPEFFTTEERRWRERACGAFSRQAQVVVVASDWAKRDLIGTSCAPRMWRSSECRRSRRPFRRLTRRPVRPPPDASACPRDFSCIRPRPGRTRTTYGCWRPSRCCGMGTGPRSPWCAPGPRMRTSKRSARRLIGSGWLTPSGSWVSSNQVSCRRSFD